MKNLKSPHQLKFDTPEKDSLKYKLKKYALLSAGILTLGVKQTKAAIVYTDLDPDLVALGPDSGDPAYQVDVDGGDNDFGIGFYYYYYYYYGNSNLYYYGQIQTLRSDFKFTTVGSSFLNPVTAGDVIGPASTYGNPTNATSFFYSANPAIGFPNGTEKFVGFRMDATGGGTLYGWARVRLTGSDFALLDYAYEDTPDVTINAGQMVSLPIELVSFEAQAQNNKVLLEWKTATEIDNYGFGIERSSDGQHWESIGFIPGQGTTHVEHEYSFIDEESLIGTYYYRLRQIDQDRTMTYSSIEAVTFSSIAKDEGLKVFPNPASGEFVNVSFPLLTNADVNISLFDANGKMIRQNSQPGENGMNQIILDIQDLQAGIYFVHLQGEDGKTLVQRFVKQ